MLCHMSPSVWGYGILAVTVINICAALGAVFYPMMQSHLFKQFLMTMVGLAVGSLSASAILVLIPEVGLPYTCAPP